METEATGKEKIIKKIEKEKKKKYKISIIDVARGQAICKLKRMIPVTINTLYPFIRPMLSDPKDYRPEVKEIYRALTEVSKREHGTHPQKWEKIRDILCMILQYDDSYFYRMLDFINEVDAEKLKLPFKDENDRFYYKMRFNYYFKEK